MAVLDETQQQAEGMSKSAKRRAAKKARDAAAAEAEAPAPEPPAPEPKAKAKGKATAKAEPAIAAVLTQVPKTEAKAEATAKAMAKATSKAKAAAKAEPAAKVKVAPEPAAKAAAAPKAAAAKPAAKPAAQKPKAPAKVEEEEKPKENTELPPNWTIDDGSGPLWEVSSGMTKKQQKRKERLDEEKAQAKAPPGKAVPGMAPTNVIPGMAPGAVAKAGAKGISQSVSADVERIMAMKSAAAAEEKPAEGNSSTATVHVPESRIGIVIGPKGSKIKMIQEKTGVSSIDTTGQVFTIVGPPQAVAKAEAAIKELVEKGYCALSYDDFAENFVNVHPSCFPDLIGKNGAVVRKIKEELGVEINFPETQKNAPPGKKYKVMLAGSAQAVEKAKAVINNIMMYSHDELTHPGLVHEELEIESWAWRYIIGTGGSEMKHIQNNYKVKVSIPRDHSLNQQVLVVGERDAVDRAKAYVEKLVWNAEHRTNGRDKVDTGDVWGDEEEEEEWMKQYLYKR